MHHKLQAAQWLPYPVGPVFAFFASPMNLPPLMPAWQQMRIEEIIMRPPPPPIEGAAKNMNAAGAETKMIVSFRPFPHSPVRLNWHTRITEFAWNNHFCDVQEQGPFDYWHHCHRVHPQENDGVQGTLLQDELEYAFRGGLFGDVANALGGRKQIEKIFAYRQRQVLKIIPHFAMRLKF